MRAKASWKCEIRPHELNGSPGNTRPRRRSKSWAGPSESVWSLVCDTARRMGGGGEGSQGARIEHILIKARRLQNNLFSSQAILWSLSFALLMNLNYYYSLKAQHFCWNWSNLWHIFSHSAYFLSMIRQRFWILFHDTRKRNNASAPVKEMQTLPYKASSLPQPPTYTRLRCRRNRYIWLLPKHKLCHSKGLIALLPVVYVG